MSTRWGLSKAERDLSTFAIETFFIRTLLHWTSSSLRSDAVAPLCSCTRYKNTLNMLIQIISRFVCGADFYQFVWWLRVSIFEFVRCVIWYIDTFFCFCFIYIYYFPDKLLYAFDMIIKWLLTYLLTWSKRGNLVIDRHNRKTISRPRGRSHLHGRLCKLRWLVGYLP